MQSCGLLLLQQTVLSWYSECFNNPVLTCTFVFRSSGGLLARWFQPKKITLFLLSVLILIFMVILFYLLSTECSSFNKANSVCISPKQLKANVILHLIKRETLPVSLSRVWLLFLSNFDYFPQFTAKLSVILFDTASICLIN